jgi:hypothetical protein
MKKQKRNKGAGKSLQRSLRGHILPIAAGAGLFGASMFIGLSGPLGLGIAFVAMLLAYFGREGIEEVIDELDLDDLIEDLQEFQPFREGLTESSTEESPESSKSRNSESKFSNLLRSKDRAVSETAKRAQYQLEQTEAVLGRIELQLLAKLSPTEITFNRYKQSSEKVAGGILSNLDLMQSKITTLEQMDYAGTSTRLYKMEKRNKNSDPVEIETLRKKKEGIKGLSSSIRDLLRQNIEALGKLEELSLALAKLNINEGREVDSLDQSLKDLETLINQVDLYGSGVTFDSAKEETEQSKKKKPEKIKT